MKASEEVAADFFSKHAIRKECTSRYDIIELAKEELDGNRYKFVEELLERNRSLPWNDFVSGYIEDCTTCGNEKMLDSQNDIFYCPICDA